MPGANCTRSLAWEKNNHTSVVTARYSRKSPGIPARNGFNGFLRALPGDRLVVTVASGLRFVRARSGRKTSANLTPAPGRQDHTTSPSASASLVRVAYRSLTGNPPCHRLPRPTLPRPPHPVPTSVTIAKRPSVGRDGGGYRSDLGGTRSGIFLEMGLDR